MPTDRGAIDNQLKEIGHGARWWEQREFRDLPHVLNSDEVIQGLINARLRVSGRPRLLPRARWLIVTTNQRVICLKQERFGRKQVDIEAGEIIDVRHGNRLRGYQITITTELRSYRIRIPKTEAFRFVGSLEPLKPRARTMRPLSPELSALSWIPGIDTVASLPGFSGIVNRVSMLSPPDYATREQHESAVATIERLEEDVGRLQQQVEFLENLLRTRAENEGLLSESALDA